VYRSGAAETVRAVADDERPAPGSGVTQPPRGRRRRHAASRPPATDAAADQLNMNESISVFTRPCMDWLIGGSMTAFHSRVQLAIRHYGTVSQRKTRDH